MSNSQHIANMAEAHTGILFENKNSDGRSISIKERVAHLPQTMRKYKEISATLSPDLRRQMLDLADEIGAHITELERLLESSANSTPR